MYRPDLLEETQVMVDCCAAALGAMVGWLPNDPYSPSGFVWRKGRLKKARLVLVETPMLLTGLLGPEPVRPMTSSAQPAHQDALRDEASLLEESPTLGLRRAAEAPIQLHALELLLPEPSNPTPGLQRAASAQVLAAAARRWPDLLVPEYSTQSLSITLTRPSALYTTPVCARRDCNNATTPFLLPTPPPSCCPP